MMWRGGQGVKRRKREKPGTQPGALLGEVGVAETGILEFFGAEFLKAAEFLGVVIELGFLGIIPLTTEIGGDGGVFGRARVAEFFERIVGDAGEREAAFVGGLFEHFVLVGGELRIEPVGSFFVELDGLAEEEGVVDGVGELGDGTGGEVGMIVVVFDEDAGEGLEGVEEGEGEILTQRIVERGLRKDGAEEPRFGGGKAFELRDVDVRRWLRGIVGGDCRPVVLRFARGR